MSIEFITAICSIVGALLAFFLAKREDKESKLRRFGAVMGIIFSLITALAVFEGAYRHVMLEREAHKLERDWIVIKDTPIEAIEFEILSPHGMVVPGILDLVSHISLSTGNVSLGSSIPTTAANAVDFPSVFSKERLAIMGRIGINISTVITTEKNNKKTIEKVRTVDCLASKFITSEELQEPGGPKSACDAAVTIPVSDESLRLSAIASWPKVSMSLTLPKDEKCMGPCKDVYFSFKAVFKKAFHQEDGLPLMIELSPLLLRRQPSAISEEEHKIEATLSGAALVDLAKEYFLDSYGYREQESFAFTMGALNGVYKWATERTEVEVGISEIVWTTSSSPTEKYFKNAVIPEARSQIRPIRSQEWCGFGSNDACWYRFLVIAPGSGR